LDFLQFAELEVIFLQKIFEEVDHIHPVLLVVVDAFPSDVVDL